MLTFFFFWKSKEKIGGSKACRERERDPHIKPLDNHQEFNLPFVYEKDQYLC